jgi:hypothetical protein
MLQESRSDLEKNLAAVRRDLWFGNIFRWGIKCCTLLYIC